VRTGVGHGSLLQIGDQFPDLVEVESVVDLDGVATRHHDEYIFVFFVEHIVMRFSWERFNHFAQQFFVIAVLEDGRNGAEQKLVFAERLQFQSEIEQAREVGG